MWDWFIRSRHTIYSISFYKFCETLHRPLSIIFSLCTINPVQLYSGERMNCRQARYFINSCIYLTHHVVGEVLPHGVPHRHHVLAVSTPRGIPHHQAWLAWVLQD